MPLDGNSRSELKDLLTLSRHRAFQGAPETRVPAGMVELVDAADSKSADRKVLRVQVSLPVPKNIKGLHKSRQYKNPHAPFKLVARGFLYCWLQFLRICGCALFSGDYGTLFVFRGCRIRVAGLRPQALRALAALVRSEGAKWAYRMVVCMLAWPIQSLITGMPIPLRASRV